MPRAKVTPTRFHVFLTEPNVHEFRKRYRDPTNKRSGTKYGELSALVNELLSQHFRANPVVTGAELEAALNKEPLA